MEQAISDFVAARQVAVVGVSRNKRKFGNAIYKTLQSRGYQVYPVHHELEQFEGARCYRRLAELPDEVDSVVVCTQPQHALDIATEAKENGIRRLWFQQGADFSEAVTSARESGLDTVSGKCILMYATPVTGIHAVHRFFAKLFGKL